jgi:hypothetical protein
MRSLHRRAFLRTAIAAPLAALPLGLLPRDARA